MTDNAPNSTAVPVLLTGPATPLGAFAIWRDRNLLVMEVSRARFPKLCLKSGSTDDVVEHRHTETYFHLELLWFVLLGAIGAWVLKLFFGQELAVLVPVRSRLIDRYKRQIGWCRKGIVVGCIGSVVFFPLAFINYACVYAWLASILLLVGSAVVLWITQSRFFRIKWVEGPYFWLAGADRAFVAQLPRFPGAAAADRLFSSAGAHVDPSGPALILPVLKASGEALVEMQSLSLQPLDVGPIEYRVQAWTAKPRVSWSKWWGPIGAAAVALSLVPVAFVVYSASDRDPTSLLIASLTLSALLAIGGAGLACLSPTTQRRRWTASALGMIALLLPAWLFAWRYADGLNERATQRIEAAADIKRQQITEELLGSDPTGLLIDEPLTSRPATAPEEKPRPDLKKWGPYPYLRSTYTVVEVRSLHGAAAPSFSPDGQFLYTSLVSGSLQKLSVPELELVEHVHLGGRISGLTQTSLGLVIHQPDTRECTLVDPDSLRPIKVYQSMNAVVGHPQSPIVWELGGKDDPDQLHVLDLARETRIARIDRNNFPDLCHRSGHDLTVKPRFDQAVASRDGNSCFVVFDRQRSRTGQHGIAWLALSAGFVRVAELQISSATERDTKQPLLQAMRLAEFGDWQAPFWYELGSYEVRLNLPDDTRPLQKWHVPTQPRTREPYSTSGWKVIPHPAGRRFLLWDGLNQKTLIWVELEPATR